MANRVIITKSKMDDLANSISEKSGVLTPMTLTEMKAAVDSITVGQGITPIGTLNIIENGIYNVTSYANAEVNVPQSNSYDALYPLTNIRADGVLSNNVLIQEKNGHVKISFPAAISGSSLLINLTDAIASTNAGASINNRQKWFDIPVGSVTHTVSNISNTSNIRWNANCRNLSSSSLAFGIGDETHTTGSTTTVDVTANQSVGCYFVYIDLSTISLNAVLEFDVSFTVNGTRYF